MAAYEQLLKQCRVQFEGLPEPVFYFHFYPMGDKSGSYGQALWSEFNYGRGLKKDRDSDGKLLREYRDAYESDLRRLLNAVMADTKGKRRGVVVIPSSTRGETNRVTELTRRVLASNPRMFADLTTWVTRSRSKEKAHAGGGRSYDENRNTICVDYRAGVSQYDVILVIDDILTTGTSFRAMGAVLREAGFAGALINFAFSHTFPSEGAVCCWEGERRSDDAARSNSCRNLHDSVQPIDALVLDLDQTLVDDGVRDIEYEDSLASPSRARSGTPYATYAGVRELVGLCIPFAIVSNRPARQLAGLLREGAIAECVYPYLGVEPSKIPDGEARMRDRSSIYNGTAYGSPSPSSVPRNVFSFPTSDGGGYTIRYYKPSPRGVNNALGYLRGQFLQGRQNARIVGLGNTYEDLVAYKASGIESVLALWGVPEPLRCHARNCWGADRVFDTVAAFTEWVRSNVGYYGLALSMEGTSPAGAVGYYELAIKNCDRVRDAAFRCARIIHASNPERAKELYQMAIAAGDEVLATNNLGALIQDKDPERAKELFERAIAAGNERNATRNLAKLIWRSDPTRAVHLLERAALAGNAEKLARDLEPLITDGREEAISLYERLIVAKDGRMANDLADLIKRRNPDRAMSLYEQAIAAGDELRATYNLGTMIMDDQPARAKGLFERSLAAGNERGAANALGCMLTGGERQRARALFERSINAGDRMYAPVNLARLIRDEDPARALELLETAVRNGRNGIELADDLIPLARRCMPGAIDLYERAVVSKDGTRANNLAESIKAFAPERAKRLYQHAIDAGDQRYATYNLAILIMNDEPERAEALFEKAVAAGDEQYATNGLGILRAQRDPYQSIELFERSCAAGDLVCAPCNLAHLLIESDPERALELYAQSASYGETEARIGLAYLLRHRGQARAQELLAKAKKAANRDESVGFLLRIMSYASSDAALGVARFLKANGFSVADETILALGLGSAYNPTIGKVNLGACPIDGKPLSWTVIDLDEDSALLLCDDAVETMAYCDGATTASWASSALRAWLNSKFEEEWLTAKNSCRLMSHDKTGDLVFCLDADEVNAFVSARERVLVCRDRKSGAKTGWWMRLDEGTTMSAPYVSFDGRAGWKIALLDDGVRPAIRVSLQSTSP